MTDDGHLLPWTDEQWATVQRTVLEAANRARVASSFLPLFGPLAPGQTTVPALPMRAGEIPQAIPYDGAAHRLEIDDGLTLRLTTITCNVYITTQEAEDPNLQAALQMLDRAATLIGRLEDAIVFNGHLRDQPPTIGFPLPVTYAVQGDEHAGLVPPAGVFPPTGPPPWEPPPPPPPYSVPITEGSSEGLVRGVVMAIETLERSGQYRPFACVLDDALYLLANSPSQSMVLPSDRITPFLDGPLLRSSTLPLGRGVVVALAGSPIDLVVASDVHVSYLQRSVEPRYVLRVSERFVLRIKEAAAVCGLETVREANETAPSGATDGAPDATTAPSDATDGAPDETAALN